ncbi:phage tail tape measure protein [Vibrio anguillarum]|uniref:phage tail tape measure protein n=1 Tax=Vibrio anguillarum TaxID=55601 RepID=UPI0011DEF694|nr:phage tail tape measure protein [Vibrio anguillarum]TYC93852.1 phage tail tape measure protein [Vibrio anguillarum]TYC97405.1 phage tail tape measure protein [Vibrio anguillarum]
MNEKLLMHIGLIDQITKPLQGITKEIQGAMGTAEKGMEQAAKGGVGLVATGFAIQNALMPAIEMDRKIGEVKSLGVTDEALKQLSQTALQFSAKYGKSATEFVAASYDIQSAIAGLDGNELSQFTKASGVLAAATKADTGTITSYMGTMYGIFKNQAEEMGKGAWVEEVAGMTASAVQMFKTTGSEMSSAFTSVGANATSAGIAMSEQMAILGTLQATMSGSEAGTKYKSFLAGVGAAQQKLNLGFTDSQGKMLPMLDILDKLKGKFGDTLDVAESDELKKAFGSDEAVSLIKLLMADTQGLGASMEALGQIKGMTKAEEMAAAMVDQSQRLEASWFAIRAAVFGMVLPAFNAVASSVADNLTWLTSLTSEYPLLTEYLGYAAIGALSLGGVVASLSLVMGIAKMMSGGWAVTMAGLNGVLKLLRISTLAMTAATWLMNAAMWANPITWVIAGIIALVAAVGAMIYWWDDLKASFGDTAVFKFLVDTIDWVIDKLNMIPGIDIEWRAGEMPTAPEMNAAQTAANVAPSLPSIPSMETFAAQNTDTSVIDYKNPQNAPALNPAMVQNLNSTQSRQTVNSKNYGDVYITTDKAFTPDQLEEWNELNAG